MFNHLLISNILIEKKGYSNDTKDGGPLASFFKRLTLYSFSYIVISYVSKIDTYPEDERVIAPDATSPVSGSI